MSKLFLILGATILSAGVIALYITVTIDVDDHLIAVDIASASVSIFLGGVCLGYGIKDKK